MKNWKTYHYDVSNEKFGSIIIGFGIGGLCAVALLGIKGKRLLVLEKHSNKATIEAITLSRMSWYEKCEHLDREKRGSDFEEDKKRLSKRILDVIEKHVGDLKGNIDQQEISTPLTVRDLANYTKGEMYGIDHSPDRFRQRWLRPQSSTKNLYFVGQDITTVGVSSALFSGLLTASTVLGQNLSSLLKD